jgi:hypothetical protein
LTIFATAISLIIVANYFSDLAKADMYINANKSLNDKTYSLIRTSELKNYSFSRIFSPEELDKNVRMHLFISGKFTNYCAFRRGAKPSDLMFGGEPVEFYHCNESFSDLILKDRIMGGRTFEESDFSASSLASAVVGFGFAEKYSVGDVVDNRYLIVGMLKKGSNYFDLRHNYYPIDMDCIVFTPLVPEGIDNVNSAFLIDNAKVVLESREDFESVNSYADQISMDRFNFVNQSELLRLKKSDDRELVSNEAFFSATMLLMLLFLTVVFHKLKFWGRMDELKVHSICGSSRGSIWLAGFLEVAIVLLIVASLVVVVGIRFLQMGAAASAALIICLIAYALLCGLMIYNEEVAI